MEELIPTLQEEGEERIDTLAEQTIIAGVQTINDKAGNLNLKTINNIDLLTTGNLSLATPTDLSTAVSTHNISATAHTDIRQAITSETTARENADTALNNAKQDKLVAGANIQIASDGKTISATDTTYSAGSGLNLTGTTFSVDTDTIATQNDIYTLQTTKQDNLTTPQLNAVNSGIDSTKVTQIATNEGDIATINGKIPTQASVSNQLADKNFVNSSVQTATANYRGNWDDWASVPTQASDYPEDYAGSHTPTVNDYIVVQDASDYTEETLEGTWRFKYAGNWDDNGKAGWLPEYQVNETPLTAAQIAAINSGITDTLVGQISTNQSDISDLNTNKLDKTTTFWGQTAQNGAVEGTLTLTESGQNATISTSGHNTSVAGIKVGNSSNYVEAGVTAITLSSNTGDIKLKPKSGSSVDVMSSKITNLATPTANTDASTKKYVDDGLATKQDSLTFGTGLALNGNEVSADTTVLATQTDLASKQNTLTAGTNIQITGDTISATDTTYTAGTGLTLAGTQFSVTEPVPSGFFTDTAPTQEGTGTTITLNNTTDAPIDNAELKGDTYQFTTTGKNLVYTNPRTNLGIDFSYDTLTGVTTISGKATDTYAVANVNNLPLPTGTYTLSIGEPASITIGVGIRVSGGTRTPFAINPNETSRTFTVPANMTGYDVYVSGLTVDTNYNLSFRLQLETGSTPTSFEPYTAGASPNPDYPQQIDTVTGEQTVLVTGKNLFDGILEPGYINGTNGQNAANDNLVRAKDYIPVEELTDYVITTPNTAITNVLIYEYKADYSYNLITNKGVPVGTYFTTDSGTRFVRFRPAYQTADTTIKFQMEKGRVATAYQPYQSQTYKVNLGKNLFDKSTVTANYRIGSDGAPFADGNFFLSDYIKATPNTAYAYSRGEDGSNSSAIAFYKADKTFISRTMPIITASATTGTVTSPAETAYIRFCDTNANKNTSQLELGTTSTTYSAYFTPIELCKLGTRQDYIWKDGSDWKIHKALGKVTWDGTENWDAGNKGGDYYSFFRADTSIKLNTSNELLVQSDNFIGVANPSDVINGTQPALTTRPGTSGQGFYVRSNLTTASPSSFKTWLTTHNTTVYYVLATATDTTITDANLIAQLEALASSTTYAPQTNITTSTPAPNLPTILTIDVFKNNYAGLLARLNKAGA